MRYQVVKQGKQWAVMNRDTNQVVEGGFFYRDSALDKLAEWSLRRIANEEAGTAVWHAQRVLEETGLA